MKEKNDIKIFFYASISLLALSILFIAAGKHNYEKTKMRIMDQRELQYDADGYFVMIDKMKCFCGVYEANTPLYYFDVYATLPSGSYDMIVTDDWLEFYKKTDMYILIIDKKHLDEIGKIIQKATALVY